MPNLRGILLACSAVLLSACASQPEHFVPLTAPLPDLATLNHQAALPDISSLEEAQATLWACCHPAPFCPLEKMEYFTAIW